ncbi:hypothetical protein SS50377_26613 [Spironucleus salmonicida]|uniref:Uncharacterized protein n=1 Tax=Spironucleus salmonicida TaxID=348837 RepID=A0A9P8LQC4_9EUKA|nr:hypothetical protein SS50377_26613 [Spironucleus salmonicida]
MTQSLKITDLSLSPETSTDSTKQLRPIKLLYQQKLKSRQQSFDGEQDIITPIQSGIEIPAGLPKDSLKSFRKYTKVVVEQDENELTFAE